MTLSQKHCGVLEPFQSLLHNDVRVHTLTKLTIFPQKIKEAGTISNEAMRTQRRDMEQRLGSEVARDGFQGVKTKQTKQEEGQVLWASAANGWRRERQRH